MRFLYTLLLYLLAPVVLLRLLWRGLHAPGYWQRWPERLGSIRPAIGERVIWLHAVSVGEVQAAAPLVRALLQRPEFRDHLLFHEYFNGDDGRGHGAAHQTGWTGLVATLIGQRG